MLTTKMNMDDAVKYVEKRRTVISPNLGFSLQLQDFYTRITKPYDELKFKPKVFGIGFLSKSYESVVARYVR